MTPQPGPSSGGYSQQTMQGPPPSFNPYQPLRDQSLSQQQQQQQQQQQPQQPNGNNVQQQPQLSPQAPPLHLSQVLHFLQTEYRRHERDRNEWEIERSEMRARIALLEGERRGSENLRADLMRRVKMLEFALRGERCAMNRGRV
jgi:striatin 1/3/4